MPPLFELGINVAQPGALEALERNQQNAYEFISRHQLGDWGTVDDADKLENDRAVRFGASILSAYELKDGTQVWVLTEADRSSTCVLLPDEY